MNYSNDDRIVLTLDAGGTNFVFSAIKSGDELNQPIRKPIQGLKLKQILSTILDGFSQLYIETNQKAVAISFSFPGPSDYKNGIIGNLENIPEFRGGIALKAMLENKFNLPVFINNDGDLFALGESNKGFLPEVNSILKRSGNSKQYKNLLGITLGTGFGAGIVSNNQIFIGDNSSGAEINRFRNKCYPNTSAEDSLTIRGVKRVYAQESGLPLSLVPEPENIFKIGMGEIPGDKNAAIKAYNELAIVAGDALANAVSLIDGLIVIGGGLSGAYPLFIQLLVDEMNTGFLTLSGNKLTRMETKAYNLESTEGVKAFTSNSSVKIKIPFSNQVQDYDPVKKIGVGISKLGTSKSTSIGAYIYALNQLK